MAIDSERKRMSVIFQNKLNRKIEAYVKGAPDLLLEKCDRILINGKVGCDRHITSDFHRGRGGARSGHTSGPTAEGRSGGHHSI